MTRSRRGGALLVLAFVFALAAASAGGVRAGADAHARTASPSAFVRVDQLGYAAAGAKRAYLISSGPSSGDTFAVRSAAGGAPFFTGTIGAPVGSWSTRFPDVLRASTRTARSRVTCLRSAGRSTPPAVGGTPATT